MVRLMLIHPISLEMQMTPIAVLIATGAVQQGRFQKEVMRGVNTLSERKGRVCFASLIAPRERRRLT